MTNSRLCVEPSKFNQHQKLVCTFSLDGVQMPAGTNVICHCFKLRFASNAAKFTADGFLSGNRTKKITCTIRNRCVNAVVDVSRFRYIVHAALIRREEHIVDLIAVRVVKERMELEAGMRIRGNVVIRLADMIA